MREGFGNSEGKIFPGIPQNLGILREGFGNCEGRIFPGKKTHKSQNLGILRGDFPWNLPEFGNSEGEFFPGKVPQSQHLGMLRKSQIFPLFSPILENFRANSENSEGSLEQNQETFPTLAAEFLG